MIIKIFIFVILFFLSFEAYAYIGPGMAAGALAAVIGFILSIFILIFSIIYFLFKVFFKPKKNDNKKN